MKESIVKTVKRCNSSSCRVYLPLNWEGKVVIVKEVKENEKDND